MAGLLLGEKVSGADTISNLGSLLAIVLVIVGAGSSSAAEATESTGMANPMAFVSLISQPFLLAIGDILLKQMGKLPEEPVSFAQGIALTVFASCYMLIAHESFGFLFELSTMAWFYLLLSCAMTLAG